MSSEIRREMEGVLDNMCKEIAANTKKEMIIEMYNQNINLDVISIVSKLTSSEVEKIINDYLRR